MLVSSIPRAWSTALLQGTVCWTGSLAASSSGSVSFTSEAPTIVRKIKKQQVRTPVLVFKGGVSGGVHLDATLPNLRALLDAEPKTDLSGLRGIAADRRKQLDQEKVERHFEAGGQGAEAAYYANVLRELYGKVVGLRDVRVDGKPTGEINRKRINALGFPAGSSPQETRNAVVLWGMLHTGTWSQRDSAKAALRSAMAAYVHRRTQSGAEEPSYRAGKST